MVVRPTFEAGSQDTVVVVNGENDGAHVALVITTLALGAGPGVAESVDRVVVVPEDGQYRLDLTVPDDEVVKDGGWNVTVLLPTGTALNLPEVDDPNGEILGSVELDVPGDTRPIAVWWGRRDPTIPIIWTLLR